MADLVPRRAERCIIALSFSDAIIGVVVPAYNEAGLIGGVIATMPDFVDHIIVVDDASTDGTADAALAADVHDRVRLVSHEGNQGVGSSIADGYRRAQELKCDVIAVMDGDGQMSPNDLDRIVGPILEGRADYVKGNRLLRAEVVERMPRHRLIGNAVLTFLSKFAHGYWHSMDPQCGYAAISGRALPAVPLDRLIRTYGYTANMMFLANIAGLRVAEVEVEPIYGEEVSHIKLRRFIPTVSWLLVRMFTRRVVAKYMVRNFHPLALMYLFSIVLFLLVVPVLVVRLVALYIIQGVVPSTTLILLSSSSMFAFMSLFFAMWMDMEDNKRLWSDAPPVWSLTPTEE